MVGSRLARKKVQTRTQRLERTRIKEEQQDLRKIFVEIRKWV